MELGKFIQAMHSLYSSNYTMSNVRYCGELLSNILRTTASVSEFGGDCNLPAELVWLLLGSHNTSELDSDDNLRL